MLTGPYSKLFSGCPPQAQAGRVHSIALGSKRPEACLASAGYLGPYISLPQAQVDRPPTLLARPATFGKKVWSDNLFAVAQKASWETRGRTLEGND